MGILVPRLPDMVWVPLWRFDKQEELQTQWVCASRTTVQDGNIGTTITRHGVGPFVEI